MPSSKFGDAERAEGNARSPSQRWSRSHHKPTVTFDFKFEVRDFRFASASSGWSLNESGVKKRLGFSGRDWLSGPMVTAMSGTVILCGCGVRRSARVGAKFRGVEDRFAPQRYSRPGKRPHVLASPVVPSPT